MEQVYRALTETLIPWIEDRFGRTAAWIGVAALITLPMAALISAMLWLTRY